MSTSAPENSSTSEQRSGFWSGKTIRARNERARETGSPIIQDFSAARLEAASYRLRVGEEIYISPSLKSDSKTKQLLKEKDSRAIPAGQFAFLTTEEEVRIPSDALGFITLRSKATKFRGLVNVSGFHVDPGYQGKLIFAVFNAGPGPIHVTRLDEWFEIFFSDVDCDTQQVKQGYTGIPSELITPIAGEFQTFAGLNAKIDDTKLELNEKLHKIEREHEVVRWAAALIVGAIIAFGVRQYGLPSLPNATLTHIPTAKSAP
jgi:dCTP deaminase